MSNNPNPSKTEEDYTKWQEDNEDFLLAKFLEANPDAPPVKDWDRYWTRLYHDYAQIVYESWGWE